MADLDGFHCRLFRLHSCAYSLCSSSATCVVLAVVSTYLFIFSVSSLNFQWTGHHTDSFFIFWFCWFAILFLRGIALAPHTTCSLSSHTAHFVLIPHHRPLWLPYHHSAFSFPSHYDITTFVASTSPSMSASYIPHLPYLSASV